MISNMILGIIMFTILSVILLVIIIKNWVAILGWVGEHFSLLGVLIAFIVMLAFIAIFILLIMNNII